MSQKIDEYFEITDHIYDNEGELKLIEWQNINGYNFVDYFKRKGNKSINFDKYLLGVFICKDSYDIYKGKGFELALNHPLFKGFINKEEAKKLHSQSMKK